MDILKEKTSSNLKTNVKLYSFPANFTYEDVKRLRENGELEKYLVDEGKNLVVDAGLQQIIDLMVGKNTTSFTHCSTGSGTNTPAAGDTDLQTSLGRVAISERYRSGLSAAFDTFFVAGDNNGSWNETGIHTAASGGTMLCRRKFGATFTKASTNTALIQWTVTLAAVAD